MILGHIPAHQLDLAGQHPGFAGQRQTFDDFLLALPMHAEIAQLLLGPLGQLPMLRRGEELAHRVGLLLRQCLAHVQPVSVHHRFQRTEAIGEFLRTTGADEGNVQFVEQAAQGGTGGEFGAQLALILNLQTMAEQFADDLLVVRILKETVDLVRHFQADIREVGQHMRQGLLHALQRTQRTRQHLRRLFADIGNAEGIDKTCQARLLAVFNGFEKLVARYLGKAFQIDDVVELQRIQIGRRADQAFVDQLLDALVAQAFDVHGPARDEVNDRLFQLRTTGQSADAAIHRTFAEGFLALAALDQLRAFNVRAAHRAAFRNGHRARVIGATLGDYLHHLRNHITGAADDHRVADHQAQTRDFVHVVQRGVGHGDAGDLHRFQTRHRSHRTGAADLEFHVEQLGEFFHRREFVRDRPARLAGAEAQFTLVGDAVDLEHHAIDFIGQRVTALADVAVILQALVDTLGQPQFVTDRHAPLLQLLEVADVGVGDIV